MSDNPISNFFGFGGGDQGDYNLGIPIAPNSSASKIKEAIAKVDGRKRTSLNAQSVIKQIEHASSLEFGAEMLGQLAQAENRELGALVRAYSTQLQRKQNVMRASMQMAKTDARMAQSLLRHQMGMGIQQAEVRGYEAAYRNASNLFS